MRVNVANGKKVLRTASNCRSGDGKEPQAGGFCPRHPSPSLSETFLPAFAGHWRQAIVTDGKQLSVLAMERKKSSVFGMRPPFFFGLRFA
jgi:hypothetical protein